MPRNNRADRRPTWVSLTENVLRASDDFMTVAQLCKATGGTPNQISSALHHLQKHLVAEAVTGQGSRLHWFYHGEADDRACTVDERVPEDRPRRARRKDVVAGPKAPGAWS